MNLTVIGVLETGEPRRPGVPINPRLPITIQQGTDLTLTVRIVKPDGTQVVLQAGERAEWAVKKNPTYSPPAILKTALPADLVLGDPVFYLTPADTKQMSAGRYTWDVWLTRSVDSFPVRDAVIPQSPLVLEAAVVPVP